MASVRIALAQINCHVGAIDKNVDKIKLYIDEAKKRHADIIAFPELSITGYPPEDLLLKPGFVKDNIKALSEIVRYSTGISTVVGFVELAGDLYNSAAFIHDGKLVCTHKKVFLPNYGVFDEYRYFQRGTSYPVISFDNTKIGMNVCEDIWYPDGPVLYQALGGDAELIININASPYHSGKQIERERMLATRAQDNAVSIAYVNMIGGQDELVFDGGSVILSESGEVIARAYQFEEALLVADVDLSSVLRTRLHDPRRRENKLGFGTDSLLDEYDVNAVITDKPDSIKNVINPLCEPYEELYKAIVTGTRDYVIKNGFKKVVIGLSGGIDSSLVACLSADAIGKENVIGVFMPSMFSSKESEEDAALLAKNLGIDFRIIPITDMFNAYIKAFEPQFKGLKSDITEENIQARIRGNLLMALSNKFAWLVLTTGNKSEMSVGYATLYGDMAGGYAVLKDVFKDGVYGLARYKNKAASKNIIPDRVLVKPPTAELRLNQKDEDSLPPYPVLDPILKMLIEEDMSVEDTVSAGYPKETVIRIQHLIDGSEYKRRQSPPGVKVTKKALGKDRRMPITNSYKELF